jgi:hypothetical protein
MNCRSLALTALPMLGVSLLAGCPDRSISEVVVSQQGAQLKDIPVSADIDILFVIDNSASTSDKQTVFAANFPKFVSALDAFTTGRPNLHIGVVDSTVDIGTNMYSGCPSPDPGDNGKLQDTPRVSGCTPQNGAYIVDVATASGSARMTNYSGTLDVALSCIAQVGASGCGFESQLEAMKRALDGTNPSNTGFIRNGAYLAIIFLTDEDDASVKYGSGQTGDAVYTLDPNTVGGQNDYRVQPLFAYSCDTPISASGSGTYQNCKPRTDSYLQDPAYYSTFLSTIKDPAQLVVAVIAGPPPGLMTNDDPPLTDTEDVGNSVTIGPLTLGTPPSTQLLALQPSCKATINMDMAIARPAVRLANFLSAFGPRGRFYSVCQGDYSAALADIGKTLFNAVSPCLDGNINATDTDTNNPGTQLDCTVIDTQNPGEANEMQTSLPACKMMANGQVPDPSSTQPCWYTPFDQTACPSPDTGWEFLVQRSAPAATGTVTEVECAVGGGSNGAS